MPAAADALSRISAHPEIFGGERGLEPEDIRACPACAPPCRA